MTRFKITDADIRAHWDGPGSIPEIAEKFSVTYEHIRRRASECGFETRTLQKSLVNDTKLRALWHTPMTITAIAQAIGSSRSAVDSRSRVLHLGPKRSMPPPPAPPQPQVEVLAPLTAIGRLLATKGRYSAVAAWAAENEMTAGQAHAKWLRVR